jgi:hypothetical protein
MTVSVLSVALIMSALLVSAWECSLRDNGDTVSCFSLKGNINPFIDFVKSMSEKDLLRVKTV